MKNYFIGLLLMMTILFVITLFCMSYAEQNVNKQLDKLNTKIEKLKIIEKYYYIDKSKLHNTHK